MIFFRIMRRFFGKGRAASPARAPGKRLPVTCSDKWQNDLFNGHVASHATDHCAGAPHCRAPPQTKNRTRVCLCASGMGQCADGIGRCTAVRLGCHRASRNVPGSYSGCSLGFGVAAGERHSFFCPGPRRRRQQGEQQPGIIRHHRFGHTVHHRAMAFAPVRHFRIAASGSARGCGCKQRPDHPWLCRVHGGAACGTKRPWPDHFPEDCRPPGAAVTLLEGAQGTGLKDRVIFPG